MLVSHYCTASLQLCLLRRIIMIICHWVQWIQLLCSRPIGRITRLVHPSVCPSVPYGLITRKQKKTRKLKIDINVPQVTNKWSAHFQWKRSEVKVTGHQKHSQQSGVMFTYGRLSSTGGSGADCRLGLTIVKACFHYGCAALRVAIDIETLSAFLYLSQRAAQRSRSGNTL